MLQQPADMYDSTALRAYGRSLGRCSISQDQACDLEIPSSWTMDVQIPDERCSVRNIRPVANIVVHGSDVCSSLAPTGHRSFQPAVQKSKIEFNASVVTVAFSAPIICGSWVKGQGIYASPPLSDKVVVVPRAKADRNADDPSASQKASDR